MFGCISLQGNVVQTHGYNPSGDIFKAVYKLATYNRQKNRFLNFFSVRSNLSSIFLYSSKSTCFKPWHFIDFSKQMSNIFSPCHLHYFWQRLLRLPFLCPPQDTCTTPGSLEGSSACDVLVEMRTPEQETWLWQDTPNTPGALANALLGWGITAKHLVILNDFLLE